MRTPMLYFIRRNIRLIVQVFDVQHVPLSEYTFKHYNTLLYIVYHILSTFWVRWLDQPHFRRATILDMDHDSVSCCFFVEYDNRDQNRSFVICILIGFTQHVLSPNLHVIRYYSQGVGLTVNLSVIDSFYYTYIRKQKQTRF